MIKNDAGLKVLEATMPKVVGAKRRGPQQHQLEGKAIDLWGSSANRLAWPKAARQVADVPPPHSYLRRSGVNLGYGSIATTART